MTNFDELEYKNYTHLQTESFGDKKKVTEELLKTLGLNEEYFKTKIDELYDLSDPITTKHFTSFLDETKSFGVDQSSITTDGITKTYYKMSNSPQVTKIIDFDTSNDDSNRYDDSWIDYEASEVDFFNNGDSKGARIKQVTDTIITPKTTTNTQQTIETGKEIKDSYNIGAYDSLTSPNGHWYIGYNVNKNYKITEAWKKNPHSYDIPSVCRAMTFKATTNGVISKVNIGVMTDKTVKGAMYVEIRTVSNGVPTTTVLARTSKTFKNTSNSVQTFTFEKGAEVQANTEYAIVLKAPICNYEHGYHIAGWQKSCYKNWKAYKNSTKAKNSGYSFGSSNNGKTWTKYLSKAGASGYKSSNDVPIAFAYEVYIKPTTVATTTKSVIIDDVSYYNYYPVGSHELYLKIPTSNPIKSFQLSVVDSTPTGTSISYALSQDNRNWITITESYYDEESSGSIGELFQSRPTFLWLKCSLNTTDASKTPIMSKVTITLGLTYSQKSYLRSDYYTADQSTMLPSNIWSSVDADIENHNANVEVDLIRDKEQEDRFTILNPTVANLQAKILAYDSTADVTTDSKVVTYLNNHTDFLTSLKTENTYIIGYFTELELSDYPSYPILSSNMKLDDLVLSASDCGNWDYTTVTAPVYTLPFEIHNCLNEINLSKETSNGVETLKLYGGDNFTDYIDTDDSRYADYIYDEEDNTITFNLSNSVFKNNVTISNNKITAFLNNYTALNICLTQLEYAEWLDYSIGDSEGSYDDKVVVWNSNGYDLIEGELVMKYNPVFARDIELPLKLDLWTETTLITTGMTGVTLKGYPLDSIRSFQTGTISNNTFVEDNTEYVENRHYTVNYQTKEVTFKTSMTTGKYLRIKYTPQLTDKALAVAYRLDRDSEVKDCLIYEQRFSTRT